MLVVPSFQKDWAALFAAQWKGVKQPTKKTCIIRYAAMPDYPDLQKLHVYQQI